MCPARHASHCLWPVAEIRLPTKGKERRRKKEKEKERFKNIKILLEVIRVNTDRATSIDRHPVNKIQLKLAGND